MNRSIVSLAALCCCLGCREAPRHAASASRDSAGIRILESLSDPPARNGVSLVAVPLTGPLPEFGDIVDVAIVRGGVAVLDVTEPHVVVLDSTGTAVSRFGGSGSGPGEFRATGLTDILVLGDTALVVPDAATQRVTLFGLDGAILQTLPVPANDGFLLDWQAISSDRMIARRLSVPQRIELFDVAAAAFEEMSDLAILSLPTSAGPLQALPLWCRLSDGRLVIGRSDEYSLRILDDGRTTGLLRGAAEARPLTESDHQHIEDLLQQSLSRRFGGAVDPALVQRLLVVNPTPEHAPLIARVRCSGDEVWVQRALPVSAMDVHILRVGSTSGWGNSIWDVFDLDAGTVERVDLPAGTQLTRITDRMIAGYTTDEYDRQTPALWARDRRIDRGD